MIGTGYPKGLFKEDMSVQARMMAIADIFEALTASDRPYKDAKSLSEAMNVGIFKRKITLIQTCLMDSSAQGLFEICRNTWKPI